MHILATVNVASHLATYASVQTALAECMEGVSWTLVDLTGFNSWDAMTTTFVGDAERIRFSSRDCGFPGKVDSLSKWIQTREAARRFMRDHWPDLLILCVDDEYPNWALVHAASECGVPSMLIQEGPYKRSHIMKPHRKSEAIGLLEKAFVAVEERFMPSSATPPLRPFYGCGGADGIAAVSDMYRDLMIGQGAAPDRVRVCGVPRFDLLHGLKTTGESRLKSPLHPDVGSRMQSEPLDEPRRILLISQPFLTYSEVDGDVAEQLYRVVSEGLLSVPSRTVLRFHPAESESEQRTKMAWLGEQWCPTPLDIGLYEQLAEADLVVGFYSSSLMEAILAGIPAIAVTHDAIRDKTDRLQTMGIPVVRTNDELCEVLHRIRRMDDLDIDRRHLAEEVGEVDGKASRRVADFILELTSERENR